MRRNIFNGFFVLSIFFVFLNFFQFYPIKVFAVVSASDIQNSQSLSALQEQIRQLMSIFQNLVNLLAERNISNISSNVATTICTDTKLCPIIEPPIRIVAGRSSTYTDTQGRVWQPDSNFANYFTGQSITYQTSNSIKNTQDQELYKYERWGGAQNSTGGYDSKTFGYNFPVPNGEYVVGIRFAEIYFTSPGQRKENVYINGQKVLAGFDPSGGQVNSAVVRTFPTTVSNGQINIQFEPVVSTPKVSAIEIYKNPNPSVSVGLKDFAINKGKNIGTAVAHYLLDNSSEPLYSQTIKKEFNMIVPENELKMEYLQPSMGSFASDGSYRGNFDFSLMDKVVNFASANNLKVRATPLVWNSQLPSWLVNGNFTGSQLKSILENHIKTVVSRYKGKISSWDVVNEVVSDKGKSIWEKINPQNPMEYVDLAFNWAREVDPNSKLYLNEYGAEGLNSKSDTVYSLVSGLKSRAIPIDGVGLQSHFSLSSNESLSNIKANMLRLKNLGLDVEITELDVWLPVVNGVATPESLQAQGPIYAQTAKACIESVNCKSILTWGFTDKFSWIPYFVSGGGAALPFDINYKIKPAYTSLLESFR